VIRDHFLDLAEKLIPVVAIHLWFWTFSIYYAITKDDLIFAYFQAAKAEQKASFQV
jgi:hypothetical protein